MEEGGNFVMLEASHSLKLTIVYENMLIGDKLIILLLHKGNHMWDIIWSCGWKVPIINIMWKVING